MLNNAWQRCIRSGHRNPPVYICLRRPCQGSPLTPIPGEVVGTKVAEVPRTGATIGWAATETAIDWVKRSIWDKHLGAHMIHAEALFFPNTKPATMRERWIGKEVALNGRHWDGAPLLLKKCSCISAAFRRTIALFIASVR
jgi:hypothetical protein